MSGLLISPGVGLLIFVPILFIHEQQLDISPTNAYLWGGVAAIIAAYKTHSVYWTIGVGTSVFLVGGTFL